MTMGKSKQNYFASEKSAIEMVRLVYIILITLNFLDICTGFEESAGAKIRIQVFKNNEKIETLESPQNITYSVGDYISYTCVHDYNAHWLSWKQETNDITLVSYPGGMFKNSTINLKMDTLDSGTKLICTIFEDASLRNIKDNLTLWQHEKTEDAIIILNRKNESDCKGLQDHLFKINNKKVELIYSVNGQEDEVVCIQTDFSDHVTWAEYKRHVFYVKPTRKLSIEETTTLTPPVVLLTTQSDGYRGNEPTARDTLSDEWRTTFIVSISVLIPLSIIVGAIIGCLCQKRLRTCINKEPIIYENMAISSQQTADQRDIASRQTEDHIDISYPPSDQLPESVKEDSKEDQKQTDYDTPYDHIHRNTTHNGNAIIGDEQIFNYELNRRLAANLFSARFPAADPMPEHLVSKRYVVMGGRKCDKTNNLKSRETKETTNKNEYYTPIQNYRNNITGNLYHNV